MEKNITKKKDKPTPEKFWQKLVDVYFQFYKEHFRDQDGFMLTPDWSKEKVGMEAKGLKGVITTLRTIAEEKNIDWTEEYAVSDLQKFLEKAYYIPFLQKSFLCCLLNKCKNEVIRSDSNPNLVRQILELWYFEFNNYTRDFSNDRAAAEKIILFLKEQYEISNIVFSEASILTTTKVLINHIKGNCFWATKSLKTISNNLQDLINKIKSDKNGNDKTATRQGVVDEINRRRY